MKKVLLFLLSMWIAFACSEEKEITTTEPPFENPEQNEDPKPAKPDSIYYQLNVDGFELIAATEDSTCLFLQTDTIFAFRCLFDSCGSNRLLAYCDSTGLVERIVADDQIVNILHHADKKKMDIFYKDAEGKMAWIKDVDSPYKDLSSRAEGDVPYSAISIVNDLSYAVYTIINTYDVHKISPLRKYPHKYARKETYNMRGTVALELIKQILGQEYKITVYNDVSQIVNVMSDYSKWVKEELYGDAIPHLRKYAIRKTNNGLILAAYVTEVDSLKDEFQIGVKASLANDDVTMGNDMSEYSSTVNNLLSFSKLPTGKEYEFRPYLAPSSSSKYWGGLKGLLDYYKYGESKKYLLLEAKAKLISTNDDDAVLQLKVENARRKMGIIYSEHEDLLENEYQKMEFEPTGEEIILPGDFEREINLDNLPTGQIYYMPYVIYDDNVINRLIYSPDTVLSAVITEKDFTFYGEKGVLDIIRNPITGAANITGKTFHASGDDGTRRTTKSRSAIEVSERGFIIQEEIESKSSRAGNYPDITVENAKAVKATSHKDGKYEVSTEVSENVTAVYYRAYIKVNDKYYYGEVKKCTKEKDPLREALIKLYESTNGDNWINNKNWCSDKPVTEWYGVSYDSNTNTYEINLRSNNLVGEINQTFPENINIILIINTLSEEGRNHLTTVNVAGSTSLLSLSCGNNETASLDITGCTSLEVLHCDIGQLTELDVSTCKNLKEITCGSNQLTSLDVSMCEKLEGIGCNINKLTSLDVSGCTALRWITCDHNQLTSLDVSSEHLTHLTCYTNQLTSLDLSICKNLEVLDCSGNLINQEIPDWFSQITYLAYDQKYIYDEDGELLDVKDYGWWYPGEPAKGYHGPN